MRSIKRILVPTDFSEGSDKAIAFALRLAHLNESEIDLINIVPEMQYYIRFISSDVSNELSREMIETAEKRIEKAIANIPEENRGEYFIKTDRKPAESILNHANNRSYDLIVIGSRGEHKSKMRRGGVALQVIRQSAIPVLTVEDKASVSSIKSILVPTDGSDLSFTAVEKAAQFTAMFGGNLTLLYVAEMRGGLSDTVLLMPTEINKDELYKAITGKLDKYLRSRKDAGVSFVKGDLNYSDKFSVNTGSEVRNIDVKTEIMTGFSPNFEIETYARKNSDLVVMATHGYSGFANLMMGSVTEKVIQYLEKPVLTIRPSEGDFKRWHEADEKKSADMLL